MGEYGTSPGGVAYEREKLMLKSINRVLVSFFYMLGNHHSYLKEQIGYEDKRNISKS